jgi:polysaccharide export outer membrane protein
LLVATALLSTVSSAQAPTGVAVGHRIGPRDLLEVRVLEDDSLNTEQRVSENGTIELPHIGSIELEGLTVGQAQRRLQAALERFLRRASVSVEVKEFRFRPISVLGAVTKPGYLPYSGRWTLLEALTEAGGVATAHGGKVVVVRHADNGLTDRLQVDLEGLLFEGDPNLNIPLLPRDIVNVPPAVEVTVNCLGAVNDPGPIRFRSTEQITLLAAIGRAGGLTDRAGGRIVVRRQDGSELVVRYKALLNGSQPDPRLLEGDVVLVKESFF